MTDDKEQRPLTHKESLAFLALREVQQKLKEMQLDMQSATRDTVQKIDYAIHQLGLDPKDFFDPPIMVLKSLS